MIDTSKYNRQITLMCPACGCTDFECQQGDAEADEIVKCASCGREMTKDALAAENSENVAAHVEEIKRAAVKDIQAEFKAMLRKSLGGSKFIKIK
jgi:uncharacterized Zn finger protein (UPF0148 family)